MIELFMMFLASMMTLVVVGAGFIARKALTHGSNNNPLYTRCTCQHLASKHNYVGCVCSGCDCRVSHRGVMKYGTYDNHLWDQMFESCQPALPAGESDPAKAVHAFIDQIIVDKNRKEIGH